MKTKPSANIAYRIGKYKSGPYGKHKKVHCKHCQKKMDSNKLGRHIGLMHEAKATKNQREKAQQSRAGIKYVTCDKCGAAMLTKNMARHLRTCTGGAV